MKKTFENIGGDILVKKSEKYGCGVVEMLHLWNNNKSGCVIAFWEVDKSDGEEVAVFRSVNDRFINTQYSFDIMLALRYGQKLAEVIIESTHEKDSN